MTDNEAPEMTCDGCEETKPVEPTPDGRALLCEECMANNDWWTE